MAQSKFPVLGDLSRRVEVGYSWVGWGRVSFTHDR